MAGWTIYASSTDDTGADATAVFDVIPGQEFPVEAESAVQAVEITNTKPNSSGFDTSASSLKDTLDYVGEPYAVLLVVSDDGQAAIVRPNVAYNAGTDEFEWDVQVAPLFPELQASADLSNKAPAEVGIR